MTLRYINQEASNSGWHIALSTPKNYTRINPNRSGIGDRPACAHGERVVRPGRQLTQVTPALSQAELIESIVYTVKDVTGSTVDRFRERAHRGLPHRGLYPSPGSPHRDEVLTGDFLTGESSPGTVPLTGESSPG